MRRLALVVGTLAVIALAAPVGACGDPHSAVPTSPSAPTATSIDIVGPGTIAPGQSVQFGVTAHLADGTVKSASPDTPVLWFSSNPAVLDVTPGGVVTASQTGDAILTARVGPLYGGRQANREIVALPDGTYRMVGRVTDAESPDFPVVGARVEVTPGGPATTTDFDGRYRLYGVPANAVIEVTKFGYAPFTRSLQLSAHVTQDFQLTLTGVRVDIPGRYTLVIDATSACNSGLPLSPALRRLVYDAVVTQTGSVVDVVLTEPRFRVNAINRGNTFSGRADTTGVQFVLEPYESYYYPYYGPTAYPSIAERLSNGTFLIPEGTAQVTGSAAGLSGELDGDIVNYDAGFPFFRASLLGYCTSRSIPFTLTPK